MGLADRGEKQLFLISVQMLFLGILKGTKVFKRSTILIHNGFLLYSTAKEFNSGRSYYHFNAMA